jgi:adenylate cyclase
VLSVLGYVHGARVVGARGREPGAAARLLADVRTAADRARQAEAERDLYVGLAAALALTLLARAVRQAGERGRAIRIGYPGGREVTVPVGFSILEASRLAGIPHASVCGGRGRCSTCRVQVLKGNDAIGRSTGEEQRVLDRIGAPPAVRLACQARPHGSVVVRPLLPTTVAPGDALVRFRAHAGSEQEVTVLFADLRRFTALAEHRLPFDVVFFLNRYFEAVGRAIEEAGGVANQFTGDGVMALFGVEGDAAAGCRRALLGARAMARNVARLGAEMSDELDEPLRIGIGIHTGPAVVGRMGYGATVYLTAVGDTVHVASRLQDLTKQYGCQLVLSEQVAAAAGLDASALARHEITVRNRREPLAVRIVEDLDALALPEGW